MKLRLILFFTALNLAVAQNLTSPQTIAGFSPFVNSVLSSTLNPAGLTRVYDWNVGLMGYYTKHLGSGMHSVGIAKRFNEKQTIGFIYSPGAVLEFIFPSPVSINIGNSILNAEFQRKIVYSSNYAFAYALKLSNETSIGLSTRYISQNFFETDYKIQSTDSLPNINIETFQYKSSFLNSKISLLYEPSPKISLVFTFENLPIKFDNGFPEKFKNFEIDNKFKLQTSLGFRFRNFKWGVEISSLRDLLSGFEVQPIENLFLRCGLSSENLKVNAFLAGVGLRTGIFQFDIAYLKNTSNIWSDNKLTQSEFLSSHIRDIELNKFITDRITFSISIDMSRWHEKNLRIKNIVIQNEIFPHLIDELERKKIGFIEVENISNKTLNAKIEPKSTLIDIEVEPEEFQIKPYETKTILAYIFKKSNNPEIKEKTKVDIKFDIKSIPNVPDETKRIKISVYGKNDWNGNVEDLKFFLKFDSPEILSLTRKIIWERKDTLEKIDPMLRKFYQAKFLFDELSKIITYVSDPSLSIDSVQYPEETLKLHTGDCDDLAVLYASMLGSVGIDFAFVDVKAMRKPNESHVYILFDSGIDKKYALNITDNEKRYTIIKNKDGVETLWIPIETTLVREKFDRAWEVGAEQFFDDFELNLGQTKGKARIVFIQK